jgi:hypothetical protein
MGKGHVYEKMRYTWVFNRIQGWKVNKLFFVNHKGLRKACNVG